LLILISGYKDPLHAVLYVISYFSILVIHEYGHGYRASKLGYKVCEIKIAFLHGLCISEEPRSEKDSIKIAWAGPLAQLIIAVPLIILSIFKVSAEIAYLQTIIIYLGYLSFFIASINLIPSKGLDGYIAWKIIPITFDKWFIYFNTRK